jgi:hypothetical protein
MDITNSIRKYAECLSNGAITEPTGGSWMSAICIWQGTPTPLNSSYLQRHCDNLGITAPLHGSWMIALCNHYGITQPLNGTWAYALQDYACNVPVVPFIWDQDTFNWEAEVRVWDTGV